MFTSSCIIIGFTNMSKLDRFVAIICWFVEFIFINHSINVVSTVEEGGEEFSKNSDIIINNTLGDDSAVGETEAARQCCLDRLRSLKLMFPRRWFIRLYQRRQHKDGRVVRSVNLATTHTRSLGTNLGDALEEGIVGVSDVRSDLP